MDQTRVRLQGGHQIKIWEGQVACGDAYALADRYDANGETYQKLGDGWTCYHRITDIAPLVSTCVSENGAQFDVNDAI